jgi:ATP:cob(I)alamin adenosyltransferase
VGPLGDAVLGEHRERAEGVGLDHVDADLEERACRSAMTSGRVRTSISLQPSRSGPPKSSAVRELHDLLTRLCRDLWVLMAELATLPENRHKLAPGTSAVTPEMVAALEALIDALDERFDPPTEFVVPGEDEVAAHLDLARTVVRRAERHALAAAPSPSEVVPYLNRLSDLLWTMARWHEGASLAVRETPGTTTR